MATSETSERVFAPPSIALALMAEKLARTRNAWGSVAFEHNKGQCPLRRDEFSDPDCTMTTSHYYQIIDRISRGEQP